MKIGIISDIHGNKKALDAVLKQLAIQWTKMEVLENT
mgnify:CR=1 FL=1